MEPIWLGLFICIQFHLLELPYHAWVWDAVQSWQVRQFPVKMFGLLAPKSGPLCHTKNAHLGQPHINLFLQNQKWDYECMQAKFLPKSSRWIYVRESACRFGPVISLLTFVQLIWASLGEPGCCSCHRQIPNLRPLSGELSCSSWSSYTAFPAWSVLACFAASHNRIMAVNSSSYPLPG